MGAATGSDNRWQGYSHQQLYDMLHSGPGSGAAGTVADRWSGMAGALSDIQQEISSGITRSGATWVGAAGDSARGALGPLGEWAQQAATAADVMRISTELQGDLLAKARADMPAPIPVPQQPSQLGQLVTAQVDYEVAELSSQVAAQQAYQVMAQYEAATTDNTSTLGDFGEPPTLVVDTTPVTGPIVRSSVSSPDSVRSAPRPRGVSEPVRAVEESSGPSEESPRTLSVPAAESGRGSVAGATSSSTSTESTPQAVDSPRTIGATPAETTPSAASGFASTDSVAAPEVFAADTGGTVPSSVVGSTTPSATPSGVTPSAVTPSSTTPLSTAPSSAVPDRKSSNTTADPTFGPTPGAHRFTGAVVPAARRPDEEDEPDDVHESKYLIEADDIYGAHQTYTPPVIGESPRRR